MKTDLRNKYALDYYKAIEKHLPPSREKNAILVQLENSLLEYSEENPEAVRSDYELRFGYPEHTAEDFMLSLDEGELPKKVDKARFTKRLLLLIFAILFIAVVIVSIVIIIWNALSHPNIIKNEWAQLILKIGETKIV